MVGSGFSGRIAKHYSIGEPNRAAFGPRAVVLATQQPKPSARGLNDLFIIRRVVGTCCARLAGRDAVPAMFVRHFALSLRRPVAPSTPSTFSEAWLYTPDPQTVSYTQDDAQQTALRDQTEEGQSIVIGQKLAPDWWRLFEWAPLDQLIREAVDKNQSLAAAQATLGQAQQAVRQASGAYYPQVSFSAGASRQRARRCRRGRAARSLRARE
jgi:hypothetical protein